jgi:hypothetical protein
MNPTCFCFRIAHPLSRRRVIRLATAAGIFALALMPLARCLKAQVKSDPSGEFRRLAAEISTARRSGTLESESSQEKALSILDESACSFIGSSAGPDLDAGSRRIAALASQPPRMGENYRLVRLGGNPAAYALVANFGIGGPAAIRIYAGTSGRCGLAAKVDRFVERDFFDSDVELVPVSTTEPVFVTVGGRTDDLSTGAFSAWRFDGHRAVPLWSSDLLEQSNYTADGNGFHLTYCSQPDEDHPEKCLKTTQDLYRWQAGEWKRVSTNDLGPAKTPAK